MFWADIMASFGPMCGVTSAIARFIPIFKLAYFWNAKTYTGEILIWRHIDGVLSEKPQNTRNQYSLFFNGCLDWKFKNCWNDCIKSTDTSRGILADNQRLPFQPVVTGLFRESPFRESILSFVFWVPWVIIRIDINNMKSNLPRVIDWSNVSPRRLAARW